MMSNKKTTGKDAATAASHTLNSPDTGDKSKQAAASALAQRKAIERKTSDEAAKSASDVLRDGRTNDTSKSAAGSALSQA